MKFLFGTRFILVFSQKISPALPSIPAVSANHSLQQDFMKRRFDSGKLHHGLIFMGADLQGLEIASLDLIRHILNMPGGRDEHPDLFHLRPSGRARIITVEKTRELIGELNQSSHQGGAKIALIHEADRMRTQAANAFLKTLEEPASDTYLILLSTRPHSMLSTIRSRCMQVRFIGHKQVSSEENWIRWLVKYENWILSLLDREALKRDRITPVFAAYGLASGLTALIRSNSENECKTVLRSLTSELDEKEKLALESSGARRVRSDLLRQVADKTRDIALACVNTEDERKKNFMKLARVLTNLERNVGLLEVNLKEETAIEDFCLSSLRIWSSK